MIKLFWTEQTRATRVHWMLEEVGEPYELIRVDIRGGEVNPEHRAASPMGKIPAIEDGPVKMADSAAICLYLADKYASGRLAPAIDSPARGEFLWWMFFAPGAMEPAMPEAFGTAQQNEQAHGWGSFDRMVATLEKSLEGKDWLVENSFSAADLMVGSTANFFRMFNIMPDSKLISDHIDRCLDRPAYKRIMAKEMSA